MGSENLRKPHIAAVVAQGQKEQAQRSDYEAQETIKEFGTIGFDAEVHLGYRLKALELLGKTQGIFVEKHDVRHSGAIGGGTDGLQATMDLVEAINATRDTGSLPQPVSH